MPAEQEISQEIAAPALRLRRPAFWPETDCLSYRFIQKVLELSGGYLTVGKEFQDLKPRTWLQATRAGRRAQGWGQARARHSPSPQGTRRWLHEWSPGIRAVTLPWPDTQDVPFPLTCPSMYVEKEHCR